MPKELNSLVNWSTGMQPIQGQTSRLLQAADKLRRWPANPARPLCSSVGAPHRFSPDKVVFSPVYDSSFAGDSLECPAKEQQIFFVSYQRYHLQTSSAVEKNRAASTVAPVLSLRSKTKPPNTGGISSVNLSLSAKSQSDRHNMSVCDTTQAPYHLDYLMQLCCDSGWYCLPTKTRCGCLKRL